MVSTRTMASISKQFEQEPVFVDATKTKKRRGKRMRSMSGSFAMKSATLVRKVLSRSKRLEGPGVESPSNTGAAAVEAAGFVSSPNSSGRKLPSSTQSETSLATLASENRTTVTSTTKKSLFASVKRSFRLSMKSRTLSNSGRAASSGNQEPPLSGTTISMSKTEANSDDDNYDDDDLDVDDDINGEMDVASSSQEMNVSMSEESIVSTPRGFLDPLPETLATTIEDDASAASAAITEKEIKTNVTESDDHEHYEEDENETKVACCFPLFQFIYSGSPIQSNPLVTAPTSKMSSA